MPDLYEIHPAFSYWTTGRYGGKGLTTKAWTDKIAADPALSTLVMAVELVFGSDHVVRVSTKPCTTTSGTTGDVYNWVPLLQEQLPIEMTYTLANPTSSARSFTVQLPASMVDPTLLVSKNRMLAGIGEVSLTFDGADYDDRIVVVRGEMDAGVSFGVQDGGILETTITDPRESADVTLPPYVIDDTTFPDVSDDAVGQRYPLVIPGFPYVPGVIIAKGTPVEDNYEFPTYLLCSGHMEVKNVYVDGELRSTSDAYYSHSTVKSVDLNGVPYTGLAFAGGAAFDLSEAVYAELYQGDLDPVRDAAALPEDPIGQLAILVRDFTLLQYPGVHHQLFAKAQAKLTNRKSKVCVNAGGSSNTSTISYIEGEFLASFPMVSMVWEGGSYGPVVTDRMQTSLYTAYLNAGQAPLISRATFVQETPKTNLFNEFTVRYSYNAQDDLYAGVATRNKTNSLLCQVSQRMVGYRPASVLDSLVIHDVATAEYVIDWLVAHTAVPSYYIEYRCVLALVLELQRGDNVMLNDDDFGWLDRVATVETLRLSPGECTVGLRVWLIFDGLGGGAASTQPTDWGNKPPAD